MVGDAVYEHHYELLDKISPVVGAFSTLFGIAAVVLGVQSSIQTHHDGVAKRIAAGGDQ
jgi:biopolymer transport protein ExbB/TolQ